MPTFIMIIWFATGTTGNHSPVITAIELQGSRDYCQAQGALIAKQSGASFICIEKRMFIP